MKSFFPLLLAGALALGALACRSNSPSDAEGVECVCGQPLAEMEGCPHSACASGERNSDNPDCVCGTLSIPR